MLKQAYQTAAIYYPFTDLVVAYLYAALTEGAKLAFVVGPSGIVGGVKTDMVVWANDDVFLQIWIGVDDKCAADRVIFREGPMALRHEVELLELAVTDRSPRTRSPQRRRRPHRAWRSRIRRRPHRRASSRSSRAWPTSRRPRRRPRNRSEGKTTMKPIVTGVALLAAAAVAAWMLPASG